MYHFIITRYRYKLYEIYVDQILILKIHIKWCCTLIFVLLQITVVRKLKCNWIYLIPLLLQVKDENCVDLIGIEIRRTRIQTFASLNLWQTSKKKDERNMKRKWLYFASKVMTEMNFRLMIIFTFLSISIAKHKLWIEILSMNIS